MGRLAGHLFAVAASLACSGCFQTSLPGRSFAGDPPPLTDAENALRERLRGHVERLAGEIGERHLRRHDALCSAADYVAGQFRDAGCDVTFQEYVECGRPVRNVIAEVPGSARPLEILIVGAHYDTVRGSPGADDNATGVAAVIELARALCAGPPPRRTVRFVAFVNEEEPFFWTERMGSRVYAARCRRLKEDVVGMIALDMLGFYRDAPGTQRYPPPFNLVYPSRGNYVAWLSNARSRRLLDAAGGAFRRHANVASTGLASLDFIVGHSDQWSFWVHGYKALLVTDTAMFRNPNYHDPTDTPATLDYDSLARVVAGLVEVTRELADADERY